MSLLFGKHVRLEVDAELLRHGLRRGVVIACYHHDLDPFLLELFDGFGCRGFDRICDGDQSPEFPVQRDVHHGLTFGLERFGFRPHRLRRGLKIRHECRIADGDLLAIEIAFDSFAGDRLEAFNRTQVEIAVLCASEDCSSKWMFACLFKACRRLKQCILINAFNGYDACQLRLAFRQSAGLIDD